MNTIKLYVIIPDISSGDYFNAKLKKHHIETEFDYYKIRPRVINDKLTHSSDVLEDLNAIFKTFSDKTKSIIIACNTLQLWIDAIKPEYKKNVKIYTTFEACNWRYKTYKEKPLWLGTTPLAQVTTAFPTLLTYNQTQIQNKVQELIWRIKMVYGDDVSTAYDLVKADSSKTKKVQFEIINILKQEIISALKKLKIKRVILGCTELPMVFIHQKEAGILFIDPAEVLAEYVKSQSVFLLFAGGTISSLARKDGALVGGHVFNLIEKLSEKSPGSFKDLNITKSDIIFSGLSENIVSSIHTTIWHSVIKILISKPSRIVITHGTDSLEQTARFLEKKLRSYRKKGTTHIILTAANFPTDNPHTDVWDNLSYAINVKVPQSPQNCVYIAFQNRLIPSSLVVKEYFLNAPMAYISKTEKKYLRIKKQYRKKVSNLIYKLKKNTSSKIDKTGIISYDVNIIRKNHDTFLKKIKSRVCKVVVFKLYHSGTANTIDPHSSVSKLVQQLTQNGIVCFGATENGEPTNLHSYETSVTLRESGMVPLYNMLFEVALHKLWLLNVKKNNLSRKEIIKLMLTNYGGEIDEGMIIQNDIKKLTCPGVL